MLIQEIDENKKRYLHLLLLADEQENMVDRYLERGTMYVLDDNGVKAECIVTDEGNGVLEIKNIATLPDYQKQGYAVTIHSQPKPVKWKTKEIVFYLKANQRFSGRYDLSGCLMSYFL